MACCRGLRSEQARPTLLLSNNSSCRNSRATPGICLATSSAAKWVARRRTPLPLAGRGREWGSTSTELVATPHPDPPPQGGKRKEPPLPLSSQPDLGQQPRPKPLLNNRPLRPRRRGLFVD